MADNCKLTPEFRVVGDFDVEIHILSALWINTTGHFFDAALTRSARGSRLRRYWRESGEYGEYHTEAIGSFEHYFEPYRRWRADGLDAIRRQLERNRPVIAATLDITSYYHSIDSRFVLDPSFLAAVEVDLNHWQKSFTRRLIGMFRKWDDRGRRKFGRPTLRRPAGVPIGLSMARVIANVLLSQLDREITALQPIYYGRYVDDLFLVFRDPGDITNIEQFFQYVSKVCPCIKVVEGDAAGAQILLDHHPPLRLQESKQKLFILGGQSGLDLLDHIEAQVNSVSSERRLMPRPDDLEIGAAAKVLTASAKASEEADSLRRADGLSVRRLGWAVLLAKVETLAQDLRPGDWRRQRKTFYDFARNHILRPDRILEQIDYVPRLLSIAVEARDWDDVSRITESAFSAIEKLKARSDSVRVNGEHCSEPGPVWKSLKNAVRARLQEAVLRAWSWDAGSLISLDVTGSNRTALWRLLAIDDKRLQKARLLAEADLASTPYALHKLVSTPKTKKYEQKIANAYRFVSDLREFLREVSTQGSLLPYLFPTRPLKAADIALALPRKCIFSHSAAAWSRYVRAVRGIWVKDASTPSDETRDRKPPEANVLGASRQRPIRIGITSLQTDENSWAAALSGRPQLTLDRYNQLCALVNQAIRMRPKPAYLVLPELSLPLRWLATVSGALRREDINLIAGLEYQIDRAGKIVSEAVLNLQDDRLGGYPNWVQIRQRKENPAPVEEEELSKRKQSWAKVAARMKPIYRQGRFAFGVLVCSEIQNLDHRRALQGKVDGVFVLAWNKDLETFSSLVEAASLDVHAYIAMVNNREYGDGRVRVPAKKRWERDLCRLRGGENDHLVVVTLPVENLRAFQARKTPRVDKDDQFKPLPEGFVFDRRRSPA